MIQADSDIVNGIMNVQQNIHIKKVVLHSIQCGISNSYFFVFWIGGHEIYSRM